MNADMERQRNLIERSGLGLLPGISVAFVVVILTMLAITLSAWWVPLAVLVAVGATGVIAAVVVKLIDVDGGDHATTRQ